MMDESSGTFEYDEDAEAGDESSEADMEATDEDSEGTDEDFETDEDAGEGSDEGMGVSFEAAGDGEATDEGDGETDEAVDEGFDMSASARLRADQDRNRRAEYARQIAADQRLEAQRAATTQRSITDRIRSIRPGGTTRVSSVGPLQGAGVVTAILPNGRRSRMRIIPTMAPISEVNRLRSVIGLNDRRQAVATGSNSRAIAALKAAQASAVKRLTDQQVKSDKDLGKRLVEGHNRLDKRITKELSGGSGSLDKHGKRMLRLLRRQRQRSIWNSVLLASSAPFFAAYGDRENPFSRNNLILTGSLLGWLVGDEIVDQFAGKSGALRTGASLWSYLAPIGNGATAFFLLDKRQHERFVSGVNEITDAAITVKVPLTASLIGKDSVEQFKKDKHAVVASVVGGEKKAVVGADVGADGTLTLTLDSAPGASKKSAVAWIVDTQAFVAIAPVTP